MIRIFSVAIPSRILTLFISESFLITACYLFAAWVDPDLVDLDSFLRVDSGALRILFVVIAILVGLYIRDLYTRVRIRSRIALLQELFMIFGVAFVMQGIINYLSHDLTVPRKVMILGSLLALTLLFGWRLLFAAAAADGRGTARLIFLGMSPTIRKVAQYLSHHPELGLAPVGYLDDGVDNRAPASLPRLGTHADLDDAIDATKPSSIVIGRREAIKPWWTDEFLELFFGGVHTEEAATLYENAFGRVCACEVWPQDLVFSDTFQPHALDSKAQAIYSVVVAFLATLVLSPVILLIVLCLKLSSSREPVLVRHQRVGLNGVPFTMYGFRSTLRPETRASGGSNKQTPFLARTGLDTLPRLVNVLNGQMALVGPQPERPEFAARLGQEIPFYNQRHRVKPGLTGWEQIHRNTVDPYDSVCQFEYDLYYMKHLSPSLDSIVLMLWLKKALVGELAAI